ncbi:MAG: hypothetical protein MUC96_05600 [Myxococcaceae bacterium]|jgi:hypothetical protein|nr:hypothetical protein [Myxococcaceae bacterium]
MTWLVVSVVAAQAGPLEVSLACPDAARAMGARLEAELVSRGFRVAARSVTELSFEPAALEAAALRSGVAALVAVRLGESGLEAWVVDRQTRQVVVRTARTPAEELLLAVDVAELLRVGALTPPARPVASQPVVEPPPPSPPAARVVGPAWVGLGLAGTFSPGGLSAMPVGHVRLGLALGARFEPSLEVSSSLAPARFEGEGVTLTASALRVVFRAGLRLPLVTRLTLVVGALVGLSSVTASGAVAAPRVGQTRTLLGAVGGAGVELEWQVFTRLAVRPSVRLEVLGPYPQLAVEGRSVATFGLPVVSAGLEGQVALF